MINSENLPASPCVRNCCLNDDDICLGCFRSLDEIRLWSTADTQTRELFLRHAAERRIAMSQAGRLGSIYFEQSPEV
ncbi:MULTISPECIES: DUF1289 domain-containing protein [Methylomonas]|uniref:DUF1289 domain-containing protein n=2 Tax=Methylomonas TaxID=416 RepID=A0A126T486_9GAMM|nr:MULTISPECIES: DUF1289 domain-containing protein [Methylomonas]AMK76872.1 hypothetical protein JT25_010285 [Methylomonas denitrificans]OAI01512.1 hypothetical protein A1342_22130 [Methylomonas methanica]TCV74168.1 uncharacterized protein DUF1289 [Methylomonas methanica]